MKKILTYSITIIMMGIMFFSSMGFFFDVKECFSCNDYKITLHISDDYCDCCSLDYSDIYDGHVIAKHCCDHEKLEFSLSNMITPPALEQVQSPKLKIVAEINQFHFEQYDDESTKFVDTSPPINPGISIVRHIKKSHPVLFDDSELV